MLNKNSSKLQRNKSLKWCKQYELQFHVFQLVAIIRVTWPQTETH